MKYRLQVSNEAVADVENLARYIFERNQSAAYRFCDAIDVSLSTLVQHPRSGALYAMQLKPIEGLRKYTVPAFPNYLIFYQIDEQNVRVIRVLHGARDIGAALRSK
jgi:toxin ParE1/3/4